MCILYIYVYCIHHNTILFLRWSFLTVAAQFISGHLLTEMNIQVPTKSSNCRVTYGLPTAFKANINCTIPFKGLQWKTGVLETIKSSNAITKNNQLKVDLPTKDCNCKSGSNKKTMKIDGKLATFGSTPKVNPPASLPQSSNDTRQWHGSPYGVGWWYDTRTGNQKWQSPHWRFWWENHPFS